MKGLCKHRYVAQKSCTEYKAVRSDDKSFLVLYWFKSFRIATTSAFLQTLKVLRWRYQEERNSRSQNFKPSAPALDYQLQTI